MLAILYDADAFPVMQLLEAAGDVARLIWVADGSAPESFHTLTLLARLGKVVDVAGRTPGEIAAALRDAGCGGLIAFTDNWLRPGAEIALELGVRFHTPDVAEVLTDKLLQRQRLAASGIAVPAFATIPAAPSEEQLSAALAAVPLPAVLKPRAGSASRDTSHIEDAGDLGHALAGSATDGGGGWLLEQFLPAAATDTDRPWSDVMSVESIVQRGECRHVTTCGRFPFAPPFRDTGGFLPAALTAAELGAAEEMAAAAIAALGVSDGVCHTELKITPTGPRIIEVNGRVGGHVPELLAMVDGPPLIEWAMRIAMGQALAPRAFTPRAVAYFLCEQSPVEAHEVDAISGLNRTLELDGVTQIRPRKLAGSPVDWRAGATDYVYAVEGTAPDHATLWQRREQIMAAVEVSYA